MTTNRVDPESFKKANDVLCANLSQRYWQLDQLERYVLGTQYAHLAPWIKDDLPLFERAPCLQYPIVARSIESNADLCLGEGRWPFITANPGEDDAVFDERLGLDEEQSKILDRGIKAIVEQARLRSVSSELLSEAQGCRTAIGVCCIRDGRLYVESTKAKHCTPTFSEVHPWQVDILEIKYPYIDQWYNAARKQWEARVLMYRRVIDATTDTTFEPALANEDGADINDAVWKPKAVIAHNFGFCPVVWYRFMPRTCEQGNVDGIAVHEQIRDEVDGLNYALSMRHRAALHGGDPQMIETGVADGEMRAPMGRSAQSIAQPGDAASMDLWKNRDVRGQSGMNVTYRKRGCGVMWSTESPDAEVKFLTLPGDALKTLEDDANDLLSLIREALAYVSVDPSDAKLGIGELSGKALEWFHKKQTDRCTKIREDFGHNCLLPLVNMLLRIVHVTGSQLGSALYLAGLKNLLPVLAKFEQSYGGPNSDGAQQKRWFSPYLRLKWGAYFPATAADAKSDMDMTIAGRNAKLLTRETAIQKIREHFPSIDDVAQYLEALDEEARENVGRMHDAQAALIGAGGVDAEDEYVETSAPPSPPNTRAAKRQLPASAAHASEP